MGDCRGSANFDSQTWLKIQNIKKKKKSTFLKSIGNYISPHKIRPLQSSLALLLCVRDALVQRGEAGEQSVALVLFGLTELAVCAVEPVQDAENAKTLIEPENRDKWGQLLVIHQAELETIAPIIIIFKFRFKF